MIENYFSDFMFFIVHFFLDQHFSAKKQTIYNNGYQYIENIKWLFEPQNLGEDSMIHLSSLFESQYESDRMRFLKKIHQIRNMLRNTYNNFQQQFLEFQNYDKLIEPYPVLFPFINKNFFKVATSQKTHKNYMTRQKILGNTYDDDICLLEQSQLVDNEILLKEHTFQWVIYENFNLTENKQNNSILPENRTVLHNSDISSLETNFLAENDTSFFQSSIQLLNQKQNDNYVFQFF